MRNTDFNEPEEGRGNGNGGNKQTFVVGASGDNKCGVSCVDDADCSSGPCNACRLFPRGGVNICQKSRTANEFRTQFGSEVADEVP